MAFDMSNSGLVTSREEWQREMLECLECFTRLWHERAARPDPGNDLISMLAHGDSTISWGFWGTRQRFGDLGA
ncbi:MAG: hypothetical protein RLO46_03580 [Pseudomonadales bacterium]